MTWAHRIGFRWASWRIRRRDLFTVDVRFALSSGGEALIFLPESAEVLAASLVVCRSMAKWFAPVRLMVLSASRVPPTVAEAGLPVLVVPAAVNRWGLPYRPVVRRVRTMTPRVAMSLHPAFDLASAYLCVESGAPLRVGFRGPNIGFFNLQYTWREEDRADPAAHYGRFLEMLADLRLAAVP